MIKKEKIITTTELIDMFKNVKLDDNNLKEANKIISHINDQIKKAYGEKYNKFININQIPNNFKTTIYISYKFRILNDKYDKILIHSYILNSMYNSGWDITVDSDGNLGIEFNKSRLRDNAISEILSNN